MVKRLVQLRSTFYSCLRVQHISMRLLALSIKTEIIPWLLETNNVLKDTINSLMETELVFRDTSNSLLGSNEVVSRRTTVSSQATQTYVVCVNNMDKLG